MQESKIRDAIVVAANNDENPADISRFQWTELMKMRSQKEAVPVVDGRLQVHLDA